MDGRGCWVLGFSLLAGVAGCAHESATLLPGAAPPNVEVRKEKPGPKRPPQPTTLVAYGHLYERTAEETEAGPAARDQFRDQARRSYQQALKVDPKNVPAMIALARLYAKSGDDERALATYKAALKIDAKNAQLWHEMGMYHARAKNFKPALDGLAKAVKLDPENKQYANALGLCQARAGYIEDSFKTLRATQGDALAHYDVGRMMLHLNQPELSRRHLRLALQADPQLGGAQQLLAELDNPNRPGTQVGTPEPGQAVPPRNPAQPALLPIRAN